MGNADQAEDADFEDFVPTILTDEEVGSECCDALFDLDVEPAEILSVEEHQWDQLSIDVFGEAFDR